MSGTVPWIGAQADSFEGSVRNWDAIAARKGEKRLLASKASIPEFPVPGFLAPGLPISGLPSSLPTHQFPAAGRAIGDSDDASALTPQGTEEEDEAVAEEFAASQRTDVQAGSAQEDWLDEPDVEDVPADEVQADADLQEEARRAQELLRQEELDCDADLRPYRGRTGNMLRRYLQYSLETGRLPSVLGSQFFRSGVTSYSVVTFEDRVIFVHDMEICVQKLSELSRQIIARYVLQGHGLWETAKLVHCTVRTTRRNIPIALDELSEILLKMGLMERLDSNRKKSCQGGKNDEFPASDCEQGK